MVVLEKCEIKDVQRIEKKPFREKHPGLPGLKTCRRALRLFLGDGAELVL